MNEYDKYFLQEAVKISHNSPDPHVKNGAIIVNVVENKIKAWNEFPRKVKPCFENPGKRFRITHAERGAIFKAFREGKSLHGAIMYSPFAACSDCANAIIEVGINRVVTHRKLYELSSDHWKLSIDTAREMFQEVGITYDEVDWTLNEKIWFRGNWVVL
jgi:dCMP deaminase